jgi:histidyl-tRNA synthetase
VKKPDREALEREGFIKCEKRSASIWLEVTDTGRRYVSEVSQKKLTKRQTSILRVLLAKGGEGFQKDIKPAVKKPDREALEREGFVKCEKRGVGIWFEATDTGRRWAAENLNIDLPKRSNAESLVPQDSLPESKNNNLIETKILRDTISPNTMIIQSLRRVFGTNGTTNAGLDELCEIAGLIEASGYESRARIDPSVVRGLEYYTGPVYEVELLLDTIDEKGRPVRFGSVGGGGRYDGLVSRFRGEPVPATGFSIGVSRLLAALTHLGKIDAKPEPGPVIVTVLDRDRLADYQRMAATLRQAGIRAELYLGSGKFGPQMKYADRRRSPCVVIQGSDEKQRGEVQIKDLIVGAELAGLSKERDDYLRKQAQAQFAVPEDRLVEAVRELLARHKS